MSPNGVSTGNETVYSPLSTSGPKDQQCPTYEESLSKSDHDEEQSENTDLVVPPDGGWGWVVVAGSFACNMVIDGIAFAFGMFLDDIATTFNVTTAYVALVGSLLSGFYLMVGPFTSALANRYGFRPVAIVGSFIASIAFGLSYFANSVMFLCITYGIMGGIGFGFIYVPAVITVGYYFEKWRALATGIGVCGSGIGTFIFAPVCAILIRKLGWRYAMLCQAAIILSCVLFGATFRPVKPTKLKKTKNQEPEMVMDASKLNPKTVSKIEKAMENLKSKSTTSLNAHQSTIPRLLGVNNNADYPTAAEVWKNDDKKVYHTINDPHQQKISQKRPSIPFIKVEDSAGTAPLIEGEDNIKPIIMTNRRHTLTEKRSRTTSENVTSSDVNRPMYRDDIFFGASLTRLPQYTSQTSLSYNLSVIRPPTKAEVEEEGKKECKICPESIRRPLATMLDLSLLKSPAFLILAISGGLTMMGFYVPFMYMKDRAILNGMNADRAVWLISTIGIANTIGRVVSGLFSSLPSVNVLLVNNVALTIGGVATILSGLSTTDEYQFTYAVVFGLSISCFASLRSVLVVDLVGLERLTNAFGLLLLFQGVAACVGAPTAGWFYDATGSYHASFYLSGSLILASAVLCYPLNIISRWERKKLGLLEEKSVAV